MNNQTQPLNISIGGIIDPSLQSVFQKAEKHISSLSDKVKKGAASLGLYNAAQRKSSEQLGVTMGQVQRMTALREKEAMAVRKVAAENSKLQQGMSKLSAFTKSEEYAHYKSRAGMYGMAATGGIAFTARSGASTEDQLIQAIITDGKGISELNPMRGKLNELSDRNRTAQTFESLTQALNVYTSANMSLDESVARLGTAGRVATATGAALTDVATTELTMKNMFGIMGETAEETSKKTTRAWNILASAGKDGSFELRNMAQELTEIGSRAQGLKMTGEKNLAWIAGALQAQVKNAGDPRTAANNMVNIMDKISGAPDFAQNAQKLGINMVALRQQAFANPDGPNIMEMFVDKLQTVMDRTPEAKRADVMGKLVQDRQAREGLKALLNHRAFIKEVQARGIENAEKDVINEDYQKAMASSAVSWRVIDNAWQRITQSATVAFAPTLKFVSGVVDWTSKWILNLTTAHDKIAGIAYPIGVVLSAYAALGMKSRLLGPILEKLGVPFASKLSKMPTLTSLVTKSFRTMWGAVSGGRIAQGLNTARFFAGALLSRGRNFLAPMFSRLGPMFMRGVMAAGPMLLKGLTWVLRGAATLVTGTVGTVLATVAAVILAAIAGWKIGQWLYNSTPIGPWLDSIADRLTGFQARLDAMSKTSFNMEDLRKAHSGKDNDLKASAISSLEKQIADKKAQLAAKESEWWTSGGDEQEIGLLNSEIRFAEKNINQLRSQMAANKASNTALNGVANSSSHNTTLKVDVTGVEGEKGGVMVAEKVDQMLSARDREVERRYRNNVSTGFIGE
jgi:hypothetical protein